MCDIIFENIEAVVQRCSIKKVFLEISQNSQENACARVSYFEIKIPSMQKQNTFLHKAPLVAASENTKGIYAEATIQRVL